MDANPTGEYSATKASGIRDSRSALRRMTPEQLLQLGMTYVAYLRAGICEGEELFAVYRADGTPMVVTDDLDAAIECAADHGLNFVAVH